ncbi:MAG: type II toxin-antitoxin system HicA family toxin [Bacteroidota bacterium]|nr:type II toxin-antitoxin system HicA family toxin [Bacteroidota bacterium]
MTSEELIHMLISAGFVEVARIGSHVLFQHPHHKQRIAVPVDSPKKQLPVVTLRTIQKVITEAGIISEEDIEKNFLKK